MSKRFTCTDKWKKPFIRSLQAPYKLLWLYMLDDCNHAGIWEQDFEVASIRIGEEVTKEGALSAFGDAIKEVGSKLFIPAFIEFQYGELNEQNRVHKSVLKELTKYKISPLQAPSNGAKDKDKDKDKNKDKERRKTSVKAFSIPTIEEVISFFDSRQMPENLAREFFDFQENKGWRYKSKPIENWHNSTRVWKTNFKKSNPQYRHNQQNEAFTSNPASMEDYKW